MPGGRSRPASAPAGTTMRSGSVRCTARDFTSSATTRAPARCFPSASPQAGIASTTSAAIRATVKHLAFSQRPLGIRSPSIRDDVGGVREMGTRMAGWPAYRTLWVFLLLGWTVSAADRALTGPVVTWMIGNDVGFLQGAANPHALG